ncbi:MAG: AMP-binding protein [Bdellovibrionales bacterium]|nr:AMP-binding protein [Bdellovibrionales bacterium]
MNRQHAFTPTEPADGENCHNVAALLQHHAQRMPNRLAVSAVARSGSARGSRVTRTFRELECESDHLAWALQKAGIVKGTRTLLMVPPGSEFVAIWFALLKVGAITILIDPGMGRKHLLTCIEEVQPEALVGIPLAVALRHIARRTFRTVRVCLSVGSRTQLPFGSIDALSQPAYPIAPATEQSDAAIVFTTGSTGIPKGVLCSHGTFHAHISLLKSHFVVTSEDVGLPAFLPFALYCVAMGTAAILPDIDPRKPAAADPAKMVALLQTHNVSYSFGSPAFWGPVARYCVANKIELPQLTRVILFGAPVSEDVHRALAQVLPNGDSYTPYGATEALPVTSISGSEIVCDTSSATRQGKGVCVGKPMPGTSIRIIELSDQPIAALNEAREAAPGQIGEIVVSGPQVTLSYYGRPAQTALAKIRDGARIWHRMGDVGYVDSAGRLWFCGRKNHRVETGRETLFSVPCEAVFNAHPEITRSALVGVGPAGSAEPVLVVEGRFPRAVEQRLRHELLALGRSKPHTAAIQRILFHPQFPVDFRHNAKIIREELAAWAATVA